MKLLAIMIAIAGLASASPARTQDYETLDQQAQEQWRAKDYAAALQSFQQGLAIAEKSHDLKKQYDRMGWICPTYVLLGDTSRAVECYGSTLAFFRLNRRKLRDTDSDEASLLSTLGSLYVKQGQYPPALRNLRASVALCRTKGLDCGASLGRNLRDLGIALFLAGHPDEAESTFREAIDASHAFASRVDGDVTRVPTSSFELEALRWLERSLVAMGRTDEALAVSQRARAGALARTLTERFGEQFTTSSIPGVQDIKDAARERDATIVEYSIVYKSDPLMQLEFSDFELLPAAELYIWVISPDGRIDFRRNSFGDEGFAIASLVREIRSAVTDGAAEQQGRNLRKAYQLLIAPIENLLPGDPASRVVLVPQDTLYLLPFAAFQASDGSYLVDKHTIAIEVSVQALGLSQRRFEKLPEDLSGMLVVGNPTMPKGFGQLPGAEIEARAVGELFGAPPLTGSQATKRAVFERAGGARMLHFATHGLLNATDNQLSALVLAPDETDSGYLRALEVSGLKLNAELAVLSACDTGEGRLTGDGVLGLSSSFAQAGTPTLMVSLWSVSDESTAALMVEFYRNIRAGRDKAAAMRAAMLHTRREFPDPYDWAAFAIIGVMDSSPGLRAVHGPATASTTSGDEAFFTIPDGAFDVTSQKNGFDFATLMDFTSIMAFYRKTFEGKGFPEDMRLVYSSSSSFSMVFNGPSDDMYLVVQGVDFGKNRHVSVSLQTRR